MNGAIHCHTEHSVNDSALSMKDFIKRAKELGMEALTITDHGTVTGIYPFFDLCKKEGIKPVLGCELYVREEGENKNEHLLVLSKDNEGLKEIFKVISKANLRKNEYGMPEANMALLKEHLSSHVILSSACINGSIPKRLLHNFSIQKKIEKLETELNEVNNPNEPSYVKEKESYETKKQSLTLLINQIKELNAVIKKPTKAKENAVLKLKKKLEEEHSQNSILINNSSLEEEYEQAKLLLENQKDQIRLAEKEIVTLKEQQLKMQIEMKRKKEALDAIEKTHRKYYTILDKIKVLQNNLVSEQELWESAKTLASQYIEIVGKENFYIEVQNHGMKEEAYVMPLLVTLARELQVPLLATNDSHMATGTEEDVYARHLMMANRFEGSWLKESEPDYHLYLKTNEELATMLRFILPEDAVEEAIKNVSVVLEQCNTEIISEPHYPIYLDENKQPIDSKTRLRELCIKAIPSRYPNDWSIDKESCLLYELDTIIDLGYADYFCIVEEFIRYGKLLGFVPVEKLAEVPLTIEGATAYIRKYNYSVGIGIGPGRGSAAGSVVAYLTGITDIDPFKYNLLFERFLNRERVSMPDIDTDFNTDIRKKCIEFISNKYGQNAVCGIMTEARQAPRGSVRNVARALGDKKYHDNKALLPLANLICKSIPSDPQTSFKDCYDNLISEFGNNKDAVEILKGAKLVERVITNHATHAAGVIISDNDDITDYIPTMVTDDMPASQCDMIKAEQLGLLKMDFLGLRNLTIESNCLKMIKEHRGIDIDLLKIPLDDQKVFEEIYSKGFLNAVFQAESSGMKQMFRQLKPTTFEDIILAVAIYRPGPLQYLDKVIAIKNGRSKVSYRIKQLKEILDVTYGYPIYQEQIMQIFQNLAGYSLGQADLVRRAMSKKNLEYLEKERDSFLYGDLERNIVGCQNNQIDVKEANTLFDEMIDFAKYAFNKSHAAAYAFISYQTAWLKYHYPQEYLCAVLQTLDIKKVAPIIEDCRKLNIPVCPPNVNESEKNYSLKEDGILIGLGTVKGVNNGSVNVIEERQKNGIYTSFQNFLLRGNSDKRVVEGLIKAGAFDCFNTNRTSLIQSMESFAPILKKINDKLKVVEKEKYGKKAENANQALKESYEVFDLIKMPICIEDPSTKLANEKESLGFYVSGHPLDQYPKAEELNATPINEISSGFVKVYGVITKCFVTNTKNGNQMAFLTIEDTSDEVDIVVFPKQFEKYKSELEEGKVILVAGECNEEVDDFASTEEEIVVKKSITTNSITILEEKKQPILLIVKNIIDWQEFIRQDLAPFKDENGCPLLVYDQMMGEIRETNIKVKKEIIDSYFDVTFA